MEVDMYIYIYHYINVYCTIHIMYSIYLTLRPPPVIPPVCGYTTTASWPSPGSVAKWQLVGGKHDRCPIERNYPLVPLGKP